MAVIDTWIDRVHPDFGGRVLTGADCRGGCEPGQVRDNCQHGTHVAGIVASTTYGVAPKARVLPLQVLAWDGDECTGNSTDVAAAIRYAIERKVHVINLSVGAQLPLIGTDTNLVNAVDEASQAGIVVVFAAGNSGAPIADSYGGSALIVAATARSGQLASYSQRGVGVDLAAPGGDAPRDTCTIPDCVISTWPDNQYAALAGTSMAAPHVAGLAALLLAQRPGRGRADVIARLRNTARPLDGAGDGLVDATAALGVRPATAPPATASPSQRPVLTPPVPKPNPRPKPSVTRPAPTPSRTPSVRPTPTPTPSLAAPSSPPQPAEPSPAAIRAAADSRTLPIGLAALLIVVVFLGVARDVSAAAKHRQHRA